MKNPIALLEEMGFDLAFLPNDYKTSCINATQKQIVIGTETKKEACFDFPFVCVAHETGHALDKELLDEHPIFREIKAWKTAFAEFLTEQPEIRLKILEQAQFRLNRYVQGYIFEEEVESSETDEVW